MLFIGVDAHKRINVALAINEAGQEVGQWSGPNHARAWEDVLQWAASLGGERSLGIEGAWGHGRGLAQHLVKAGEIVYEINSRWTASGRRTARRPGKSDRQDAKAVAVAVRQEAPHLPMVSVEDDTAILDLLTSEREAAIAESIRLQNQLHGLLQQLEPGYENRLPGFKTKAGIAALETYQALAGGPVDEIRAASVRRLALRLRLAVEQTNDLKAQIEELAARHYVPLTEICGVNLLTAATLAGILGPGRRFSRDSELAAYAGVCPLETSSAGHVRHRLNRGGNRRLNAVIYRIAITQAHHLAEARAYISRRVSEGKSRREAHRCLRRYIVRAVWRRWMECLESRKTNFDCAARSY